MPPGFSGGVTLLVTAGWWVAIVLLTPAADRPFVGSSTDNNILNLILGYNGFGRLTGNESGGLGFTATGGTDGAARGFGGGSAFGDSGGITRLFSALTVPLMSGCQRSSGTGPDSPNFLSQDQSQQMVG